MKKYILSILVFLSLSFGIAHAASILAPYQGGTGQGATPTYGQVLVGNSSGTMTLTATSSLGITGAGGGTVTSVATNNGLTGGTITGSGTLGLNIASLSTNALVTWNGSNLAATGTPALTAGYFIATSTATSTLSGIQGTYLNLTGSSASSTASNGFNITSGCYAINGTCVGGSGGSGTVNSGTANQTAYYASSGTAVSGTSTITDLITQDTAIGTTSPSSTFNGNLFALTGGNNLEVGNNIATYGNIYANGYSGGVPIIIGSYTGFRQYPSIWLGITPANQNQNNYSINGDGFSSFWNAPSSSGVLYGRIANGTVFTAQNNSGVGLFTVAGVTQGATMQFSAQPTYSGLFQNLVGGFTIQNLAQGQSLNFEASSSVAQLSIVPVTGNSNLANIGVASSSPNGKVTILATASSTPNLILDSTSNGGCIINKDTTGGTWTEIYTQGGQLFSRPVISITSC